ncbi:hypothetical protein ATEIFO6365_0008022100 [Aspergillus terreus]|uniref:Uncharacterized protein n=1 Tax=Aspergillus terreus TaxID=33178 RepID=A0A5M3ZAJ0_ASPTE|nr:hypothetical protein ATETN484_0010023000 [Aspergillus terreus]GFF18277.1 hypothetical protein ATEIFO6365_0008022100 [Aspergillus terreus]
MYKLKAFRHKPSPVQSNPVPARPDTAWEAIGPASLHLEEELEKLYWDGVRLELQNIIHTLHTWRQPEYASIHVDNDDHVHGFDTFIDHVSLEARQYAIEYGNEKKSGSTSSKDSYIASLENVIRDAQAERSRIKIRTELRELLRKDTPKYTGAHHLAWTLLQAAGFLDIDKLIEHVPSKTPSTPQLKISSINKQGILTFAPQECTSCNAIIQGSMFTNPPATIICEDCYFAHHYGDISFTKKPKHCILETIDAPMSQRLCLCRDVVRVDSQGRMRNLFPIAAGDNHLNVAGGLKCMLLRLGDLVTQAKYEGLLAMLHPPQTQTKRSLSQRISIRGRRREREPSRQPAPTDADIAQLLNELEEKHPVQRSTTLRIGPILVEIAHGRIVISPCEPAVFHETLPPSARRCLAIAADSTLSQQQRLATPKRTLAILKQVVGAPFTALDDSALETEIVNLVVAASETDSPSEDTIQTLLDTLHTLLDPRLTTYLASLTTRLTDSPSPSESLTSLLDTPLFLPLIPNTEPPLYLLSFLSTPPSPRPVPHTKHDIAPGLIETYLRAPLHRSTDFLDASTEYWTDWCAPVPDPKATTPLFPWDCTEAYNPATARCGSCPLSKHLWAYPLDAWSTLAHHLIRPPFLYPPQNNSTDWIVNRRTLLAASETLVKGAVAMARSPRFSAATPWLSTPVDYGHGPAALERIAPYARTGGIHPARPPCRPVLLSPWANLDAALRRERYVRLREEMVRRGDMGEDAANVYARTGRAAATATVATAIGVGVGVEAATVTTDAQIGVVWCEVDGAGAGGGTGGTFASLPANCGSTGCGSSSACGGCGGSGDGGGSGGGGCGGGCGGGSGGGGGGSGGG